MLGGEIHRIKQSCRHTHVLHSPDSRTTVYIVGVVHGFVESVQEVERLVYLTQPSSIVAELCWERAGCLRKNICLRNSADEEGKFIEEGDEFAAALCAARSLCSEGVLDRCTFILGDRYEGYTNQRIWAAFWRQSPSEWLCRQFDPMKGLPQAAYDRWMSYCKWKLRQRMCGYLTISDELAMDAKEILDHRNPPLWLIPPDDVNRPYNEERDKYLASAIHDAAAEVAKEILPVQMHQQQHMMMTMNNKGVHHIPQYSDGMLSINNDDNNQRRELEENGGMIEGCTSRSSRSNDNSNNKSNVDDGPSLRASLSSPTTVPFSAALRWLIEPSIVWFLASRLMLWPPLESPSQLFAYRLLLGKIVPVISYAGLLAEMTWFAATLDPAKSDVDCMPPHPPSSSSPSTSSSSSPGVMTKMRHRAVDFLVRPDDVADSSAHSYFALPAAGCALFQGVGMLRRRVRAMRPPMKQPQPSLLSSLRKSGSMRWISHVGRGAVFASLYAYCVHPAAAPWIGFASEKWLYIRDNHKWATCQPDVFITNAEIRGGINQDSRRPFDWGSAGTSNTRKNI
eukprot:jgi/Bigna1/84876/estExt_fgenesh1_pg.C_10265